MTNTFVVPVHVPEALDTSSVPQHDICNWPNTILNCLIWIWELKLLKAVAPGRLGKERGVSRVELFLEFCLKVKLKVPLEAILPLRRRGVLRSVDVFLFWLGLHVSHGQNSSKGVFIGIT